MDVDAVIRVFALKYLQAGQAAETVTSIFGDRPLRVAIDPRAHTLIVAGAEDALDSVGALLAKLDVDSGEDEASSSPMTGGAAPRSLLVRIFWLADGLGDDEGRRPIGPLPQSVVEAVSQLGLDHPRLVGQTVNALSRDGDPTREVGFQTRVPALLFKQPVQLQCIGAVSPVQNGRVDLTVEIDATGPSVDTELSGSLTAPLGHYMVLGTANSVSADAATLAANAAMGAAMGGRGGGGEFGGRGGFDGGGQAPAFAEPKYDTSHFAFVVQVVEGESFPADE